MHTYLLSTHQIHLKRIEPVIGFRTQNYETFYELIEKETNSLGIRPVWDPLYDLISYLVRSCEVGPVWSTIQQPKGGLTTLRKKKGIFVFGTVGPM